MRTTVRATTLSLFLSLGLLVLGAASASAFSTTMTNNYGGGILTTGDTVTVTVDFDTEGANELAIVSVSVLFNDEIMAWNEAASASPTYALYAGRSGVAMGNLSTNLTLRTGTSDQILLDWSSDGILGNAGSTLGCGPFGTFPAVPGSPSGNTCGWTMATLVFSVIDAKGDAAFTVSNSSPGNILQLIDNTTPANPVSGDFVVLTPEPTTALLVGLGLAGLGVAGRRRS
jgi:hypothetical protein